MPNEVRVGMTPMVGAMMKVLVQPFWEFIERLREEGKVTDAEIEDLRNAILTRSERLHELTTEELRKSAPEGWKIPRPVTTSSWR